MVNIIYVKGQLDEKIKKSFHYTPAQRTLSAAVRCMYMWLFSSRSFEGFFFKYNIFEIYFCGIILHSFIDILIVDLID